MRELLHEFEGKRFNAFDEEGIPGVTGVVGRGSDSGPRRSDPICNLDQVEFAPKPQIWATGARGAFAAA